jgi:hypothetical protein
MGICNDWKSTDDLDYTLIVEPSTAQSILFGSNKNRLFLRSNDMIRHPSRRQTLLQG